MIFLISLLSENICLMKKIINKKNFFNIKNIIFFILLTSKFFFLLSLKPEEKAYKNSIKKQLIDKKNNSSSLKNHSISWERINNKINKEEGYWQRLSEEESTNTKKLETYLENASFEPTKISIINRSLVFDNERIGPDISWVVPPGLDGTIITNLT